MTVNRQFSVMRMAVCCLAMTVFVAVDGTGVQTPSASPRSSCIPFDQGRDLLNQGQFRQAELELAKASRVCPRVAEVFNALGLAYDFDGHSAEAQAAYRKAISVNPRRATFHNNLATSLIRSGRKEEGIAEFRKVLQIDPANQTANLNLADIDLADKQYQAALRYLQTAHAGQSKDPLVLLELTAAYFGIGDTRTGRAVAERLAGFPGLPPAVHFSLGLQLAGAGEYAMAVKQFQAVPPAERDVAADLNLGMAESELKRYAEARKCYDDVLRQDPSNPDALLHIGLDTAAAGENIAALDWLTQAHARAPQRTDIACALAREWIRSGDFEQAHDLLASELAVHPHDPDLQEARGDLRLKEDRPQEASAAYLEVLTGQPRRISARLSLALAYQQMGQRVRAIAEGQRVLGIDPGNAAAMARLGHLAIEAGQQETARKWITQALAADPNNLMAGEDQASLLERAGKPEAAADLLQRLVKLEPNNPTVHYLFSRALAQIHKPEEARAEFELSQKLYTPQGQQHE